MKMQTDYSVKIPDMDYLLFVAGHSWEMNKCRQCGTVRTNISTVQKYKGRSFKSRACYSKDGFKTIDTSAGKCFVREPKDDY